MKLRTPVRRDEETLMTDRPRHPDAPGSGDRDVNPADRSTQPGAPRWVKVFALVAVVLIVLLGALHLTGNGLGSPGSHTPATERGVEQP